MSFSVKKSYMDKIRKDQQKFSVPAENPENEDDIVVVKNVVDGTIDKNSQHQAAPSTQKGGNRMRKTIYTYADR